MSIKSKLKKLIPHWIHYLYNHLISKRRIADRLGSWFELDWKHEAASADTAKWVDVYDKSWEHWRKQDLSSKDLRKIRENIPPDSTVLDAGCGDGYLLEGLADRCSVRVGVDLSRIALQKAEERLKRRIGTRQIGRDIILVQGLIEDLPFADNCFDVVVSAHTIEHVRDLDRSIAELKRVASRKLVILVPCQEYLPYTEDYHLHFFTTERELLSQVGILGARCRRYSASRGFGNGYSDCGYRGDVLLLTADLA